jgi:hypothetical protein
MYAASFVWYTESYPVTKADVQSLDFTVMRFLMKIFKSSNRDLIINCIGYFNFSLPSDLLNVGRLTLLPSWINFLIQFIDSIS